MHGNRIQTQCDRNAINTNRCTVRTCKLYLKISAIEKSLKTFVSGIVSERISDVVDAYEHALLGRFPRARYLVGKDAKLVWIPFNHWMPEWLGDLLLEKLAGERTIPRAVTSGKYK